MVGAEAIARTSADPTNASDAACRHPCYCICGRRQECRVTPSHDEVQKEEGRQGRTLLMPTSFGQ
jgi:hypothetical protein